MYSLLLFFLNLCPCLRKAHNKSFKIYYQPLYCSRRQVGTDHKTSQELQILSRSLSDCQSLILNVMISFCLCLCFCLCPYSCSKTGPNVEGMTLAPKSPILLENKGKSGYVLVFTFICRGVQFGFETIFLSSTYFQYAGLPPPPLF